MNVPLTSKSVKLTQTVSCAGCAAKLDPNMLSGVLSGIQWPDNEKVLLGFEDSDDAGVYQYDDGSKLIATTDFFTPIVDDPFTYGAAAATNALSDIYAMGGEPLFALNLVQYPESLGGEILSEILAGGADACRRAGCPIVGGHSVKSDQMTYGLAVTGRVGAEQRYFTNAGAESGDVLILTKALGTGIMATATKKDLASEVAQQVLADSLLRLNDKAGALLHKYDVHAVCDITGFSLAGHGAELALASEKRLFIETEAVSLLPGIAEAVEAGCLTRGDASNRLYAASKAVITEQCSALLGHVCFDPQSSGGLLIAVQHEDAAAMLAQLHDEGDCAAAIIGRVEEGPSAIVLN